MGKGEVEALKMSDLTRSSFCSADKPRILTLDAVFHVFVRQQLLQFRILFLFKLVICIRSPALLSIPHSFCLWNHSIASSRSLVRLYLKPPSERGRISTNHEQEKASQISLFYGRLLCYNPNALCNEPIA